MTALAVLVASRIGAAVCIVSGCMLSQAADLDGFILIDLLVRGLVGTIRVWLHS